MDNTMMFLLTWILWSKGFVVSAASPFFFIDTKCDWESCKATCEADYGRLAVLDSQTKYDLLENYHLDILLHEDMHIGLYTTTLNCTNFTWVSGDLLDWSNWDDGEPNQCFDNRCVRLRHGFFRTASCSSSNNALCEYGGIPESFISTTSMTTRQVTHSGTTMTLPSSSVLTAAVITTRSSPASPSVSSPAVITTSSSPTSRSVSSPAVSTTTSLPASPSVSSPAVITSSSPTSRSVSSPAVITTQTTTYDPSKAQCFCSCKGNWTQLSQTELLESLALLKVQLTVTKSSTSLALRKRISINDSRASSLAVGGVSIVIISVLVGLLVIPDIITIYQYLSKDAVMFNY